MSFLSRSSIASRFSALSDRDKVRRGSDESRRTNGRPDIYTVKEGQSSAYGIPERGGHDAHEQSIIDSGSIQDPRQHRRYAMRKDSTYRFLPGREPDDMRLILSVGFAAKDG